MRPADVTDEDAIRAAVDAAVERFGRLDAVVHAAQVMAYGRSRRCRGRSSRPSSRPPCTAPPNVARVVLPVFREQGAGHLVVVNSLLGQRRRAADGQLRGGEVGPARARSACCSRRPATCPGISVSAVQPGGVDTPIYFQAASWTGSTGRPPPPVYSPQRVARRIVVHCWTGRAGMCRRACSTR